MSLKHLFDAELQYQRKMPAVTSPEGNIGTRLGSGDGRFDGSRLRGTIRWDIYEKQGRSQCETNIAGVIETDDGAQISFDSLGFGMVPDTSSPHRWSMVAALRFESEDQRYTWLNTFLALWEGEFDMQTGRHRYRAYSRFNSAKEGAPV